MKTRISFSNTLRITDCSPALIKRLDEECRKRNVSRHKLISMLSENPLETKEDIKALQLEVKLKGFKTIELWLAHELGVDNEDSSN